MGQLRLVHAGAEALCQSDQLLVCLMVFRAGVSVDPFSVKRMPVGAGMKLKDPPCNVLVAQRAGQDRHGDLRSALLIADLQHIGGVGAVVERGLRLLRVLQPDPQTGHVPAVDVHLAVHDLFDITGKEPHALHILGLGDAQGKDPGVIDQVEIVLDHVEAEFVLIERSVRDPLYKGVVQVSVPETGCAL